MSLWTTFKATLLEDDGSLAMAEVNTISIALVVLGAAVRDLFAGDKPFPYLAVCAAVGTLNTAYGLADWIRKGKWRPGEQQ